MDQQSGARAGVPARGAAAELLAAPPALTGEERDRVRGRRILFLMASRGHVPQEALKPADHFDRAGCLVTFASLDGAAVRFDPIGRLLAVLESPWDPTLRLMSTAASARRFDTPASVRALRREGRLDGWLASFDAIVVPGGHGRIFSDFLRDPLTNEIVQRIFSRRAVVGLICHATVLAAQDGRSDALARGRVLASWPRAADRFFGAVPRLGRYMVPFPKPAAVLLEEAGAEVHDALRERRRAQVAIDGTLVTARGPWNDATFAGAVLRLLASLPGEARAAG